MLGPSLLVLAVLSSSSDIEPVQGRVRLLLEIPGAGKAGSTPVGLGDVDGDGIPDLACGWPSVPCPPEEKSAPGVKDSSTRFTEDAGCVTVFSGKDGRVLWEIVGKWDDELGTSLAAVGDIDGDGITDLVAGAPQEGKTRKRQLHGRVQQNWPGYALVVSGATGRVLQRLCGSTPSGEFGATVAAVGDLNLDGVPDVAVGAPADGLIHESAGSVRIYSGRDGFVLRAFSGSAEREAFGLELGGGGDVGGDGVPDFLVGTGSATGHRMHVLSGAAGAVLRTHALPDDELFSRGLAIVPDVNGDGGDEIFVARLFDFYVDGDMHSYYNPTRVRARLLSGADGSSLATWDEPVLFTSSKELGRWSSYGRAAFVGDVDGDGTPDIGLGASSSFEDPHTLAVLSGRDGRVLAAWCDDEDELRAEQFAGIGDIDHDGKDDLALAFSSTDTLRIFAID